MRRALCSLALPSLALLAVVGLSVACSDSTSTSDSGALDAATGDGATADTGLAPDGGVTIPDSGLEPAAQIEAVCRAVHGRICAGFTACGCRLDVRGLDPATCSDTRTAECVASLSPRIAPDLTAGKVHVDPSLADRCYAALDTMIGACRTARPDALPFECALLFIDVADVGRACKVSGGGLIFCGDGAGVCTPGREGGLTTCVKLPVGGEPCLGGELCANDLACKDGTCSPLGAENAPCTDVRGCAAGLVCNGSTMTCRAPGSARATCLGADDCAPGLVCTDGACAPAPALGEACTSPIQCGSARTCGRAPETRTCGDALGAGETCEPGACATSLLCDTTTMSCVALPGVNEACLNGVECAPGLACADGTSVCRPLPTEGETCFPGARFCAPGLGCDQTINQCAQPGGDGAPCLLNPPDYLCASGFGCAFEVEGSFCRPLAATGGPCTNDRSCTATNYCDFGDLTCKTKLGVGATCTNGNECAPELTCTRAAGAVTCQPIPARDEPCVDSCTDGLACRGPGGLCAPELCVIP